MTETTITALHVKFFPNQTETPPEALWDLDDGRVLARYHDGRELLFDHRRALGDVHPYHDTMAGEESRTYEAPPLEHAFQVKIDWAEIHHLVSEVDRARRGSRIGHDGRTDAFGGVYCWIHYQDLASLVRIKYALDRIARDAWTVVHKAARKDDVDGARQACRVAIACSRLYAALHRCGLADDPSDRICGTGRGYGLTGLLWLAGYSHEESREVSSEDVERFAAGGPLPTKAERKPETPVDPPPVEVSTDIQIPEGESFRRVYADGSGVYARPHRQGGGYRVTVAWPVNEAYGDDPGSWLCGCELEGQAHTHRAVDVTSARKATEYAETGVAALEERNGLKLAGWNIKDNSLRR